MSNPWTEVYKDIREPFLQEKMAKKDYDGDGKIETGTQEYMGSRDKAIKKAMGKDPKKEMKKEEKSGEKDDYKKFSKFGKTGMKGGGLEKVPDMVRGMNKESMHSSNPAQQAAIAMAKKKREEDMMVDKKKKMKEEMKVQPPAQKLKTDRNMFQIPKSEQDAARERVLAKTKAKREKMAKEDVEPVIEEMESFGLFMDMFVEQELEEEVMDDILEIIYEKCWKGYEKKGMQTIFGKRYPRCMKKEEVENVDEAKIDKIDPKNKRNRRNVAKFGPQTKPYDPPTKEMKTRMGIFMQKTRQDMHKTKRGVKKEEIALEAVYGGEKEPDTKGMITNADKKGNTLAYQNYMKGMKSKVTGKPMYKAADHMKDDK